MSADKKIDRTKAPYPQKEDKKQKSQDVVHAKVDDERKKMKRVNYIIKDLPIY